MRGALPGARAPNESAELIGHSDLNRLISAWPTLDGTVRAAINALVQNAAKAAEAKDAHDD